jgi:chemotaxis protein histidine kinase CheA
MSFDNTISESKIPNYSTGESASVSLANIPTENQSSYNSFSCPDITEEEKLILKNIKDKTHILLDLNSHNTRDAELARALQDLATANAALVVERAALVLERAALVDMTGERDVANAALATANAQHAQALANANAQHAQDLANANAQHAQALVAVNAQHVQDLAAETQQKDQANAALATAKAQHAQALVAVNAQHVQDLAAEQTKTQNAEQALAAETKLKEQADATLAKANQDLANANTQFTQNLKNITDERNKAQKDNQALTAANTQLQNANQQALQNANQQANQQQLQDELTKLGRKYVILKDNNMKFLIQLEFLSQFLLISRHIDDLEFIKILKTFNQFPTFLYTLEFSIDDIDINDPGHKIVGIKNNFYKFLNDPGFNIITQSGIRIADPKNKYKPNNMDSDFNFDDPMAIILPQTKKINQVLVTNKTVSNMSSVKKGKAPASPASPTTGGYESIYDEIIIWCVVLLILLLIYYLFYVKKDNPLRNCILNQTKTNNKKIIYLNEDITC